MNPKLSILLPVRNGGAYLEACLASVFQQSMGDFEVLVSDDGSTDHSISLIQSFADRRLKFFHGPRRGLFANLNFLARQATGDIVRILCQDDLLKARCLERELAFFLRYPLVGITFSKACRIDGDGNVLSEPDLSDLPEVLSPDLSQQHFFYHGCIAGNLSTVAFRRRLLADYGFFDESFDVSGDYEYWARVCEKEFLGIVQEPLVELRVHQEQLSRQYRSLPKFVVENRRIRQRVLQWLPSSIRRKALRFERMRHDVMDIHAVVRCVLEARFGVAAEVLMQFEPWRLATAVFHWGWTVNNRFYRPQAPWLIACAWPRLEGEARSHSFRLDAA